jgi:hypothetical protein
MPFTMSKQVLLGNEPGSDPATQRYYAFPSLLKQDDETVLITYKQGIAHYRENEAPLPQMVFHPTTHQVISTQILDSTPGWVHQNPELMRMPNRNVVIYVDVQRGGSKERVGMREYRSQDGGKTFDNGREFPEVGRFGYGYAFDDARATDGSVVMLAMSFPELTGGIRAVHALRTRDSGANWEYVRNLNEEFRFAFNESSLIPYEGGFLIAARGDNRETRLYRTDEDFRLISERFVSDQYEEIDYIGRPKLFVEDGKVYLLCRNIPPNAATTLRLYRLNPQTLELEGNVLLDRNESSPGDSYYAESYFHQGADGLLFNIITYVPLSTRDKPDLVRLEANWSELLRAMEANAVKSDGR